ncbi:hypothetical protein BpHYR1_052831 [Brachionus plicatilis]|uniref:Uncharacterized protein n=1 Tax=Brachionus plicatilis TaxID=10195 RepID=A0A3M7R1U2_BRAPC|nr:hypothetical protein BpHYR1_052831 [Brachionus plicatilis]
MKKNAFRVLILIMEYKLLSNKSIIDNYQEITIPNVLSESQMLDFCFTTDFLRCKILTVGTITKTSVGKRLKNTYTVALSYFHMIKNVRII